MEVLDIHHSPGELNEKYYTHFPLRRSAIPRPLSEATVIFDTDDEDDSATSLAYDSQSTLSDDLPTPPDTAGLGGFTFHFDTQIKGPTGPHLFRASSVDSSQEILELSSPPRRVNSLPAAVAQLDESQVKDWSPRQVADWMAEAGFEASIVNKFLVHDIYGSVLLDLQFEDLKEIEIESFGKRRRVMSSIQKLRASSVPVECASPKSADVITRAARQSEAHVNRRGRKAYDEVTPGESISIVAIEQALPEPHVCPKGKDCPKWVKRQRKIEKIKAAFAAEEAEETMSVAPSVVAPSVAASSDVFGPSTIPIRAEYLHQVQARDAQENVRQFLDFQNRKQLNPFPPPAPSAVYAAKSQRLQELPRLRIPSMVQDSHSPDRTPISALRNPTQTQVDAKAALRNDPYHYGGVASPVDVYRIDTPMSTMDLPITAIPIDPCQRDASQSVPPEMRYGGVSTAAAVVDPVERCSSVSPPRRRRTSFTPAVPAVIEVPPVVSEVDLNNHSGWMRKRITTRILKHEWKDHYFNLNGNKLDMHATEESAVLESLDVDEYDIHAYTTAPSSKLKSAFTKATKGDREPGFAFTLLAEDGKKSAHHFAVNSGRDRVEWIRRLMLAKAIKKNVATAI